MDFRLQVATYGWLTDELIAPSSAEASSLFAQLATQKYLGKEAMGGGVIRRASDPRVWDVPVGDRIDPSAPIEEAECATCGCALADHEDGYGRWHGCRGARSQTVARLRSIAAGVLTS